MSDLTNPTPRLVFVRQLDRMLDEFLHQRNYTEWMVDGDLEAFEEARRRIHVMRLSVAFAENAPDAGDLPVSTLDEIAKRTRVWESDDREERIADDDLSLGDPERRAVSEVEQMLNEHGIAL